MQALYFDGQAGLRHLPRPEPGAGEALVQVRLAGICRTDLEVLRGYHGFRGVMGHEFVGQVAGPTHSPWLGKRVVGEINVACGHCQWCRQGLARHCASRQVLGLSGRDGVFAHYVAMPEANLHEAPPEVPDDAAVFAEPLAAALQVIEAAAITPASRVLVVGDGRLGLLIAWVISRQGAAVSLVGRRPGKLALAVPYGVEIFLEKDLPDDSFYDVVVEASGAPGGLALALARVRPQGTVVLKSTYAGAAPLDTARLVVPEVRLIGSRCGPFDAALRLLRQKLVDPRPLISHILPLAQGVEALALAQQPGVLKVLLDCRAAAD
jgi:threonine dehydrogenase-like Zn-dependent dehydrogenase